MISLLRQTAPAAAVAFAIGLVFGRLGLPVPAPPTLAGVVAIGALALGAYLGAPR